VNNRLVELLDHFKNARILVLGDFILDEFVFGEISRVSREAPVLILKYQETKTCPGGGANTVANIAALGAKVTPLGVTGDDGGAEQLLALWPDDTVEKRFVIRDPSFRTTRKVRILAGSFHSYQQQVVRLDYESALTLGQQIELRILDSLRSLLPDSDALVISDYSLGNLTSAVRGEAIRFARELEIPVIVDSRDNPHKYPGATTITPNITEVEKTLDVRIGRDLKKLEIVGREVLQTWDLRNLLVTRGKLGLSLIGPDQTLHLEAHGSEDAVDVTGAGDTVAAAYATALASGAPYEDAARLANVAGGLVVMKKGTSTVSPEELRETMTSGK
jgi:rfaE bifunctional protein kinase chain/domain